MYSITNEDKLLHFVPGAFLEVRALMRINLLPDFQGTISKKLIKQSVFENIFINCFGVIGTY